MVASGRATRMHTEETEIGERMDGRGANEEAKIKMKGVQGFCVSLHAHACDHEHLWPAF